MRLFTKSLEYVVNCEGLRHHDVILVMRRYVVAGISRGWDGANVAQSHGRRQDVGSSSNNSGDFPKELEKKEPLVNTSRGAYVAGVSIQA